MKKNANTSWKRNVALLGAAVGLLILLILQYDRPAPVTFPVTQTAEPIWHETMPLPVIVDSVTVADVAIPQEETEYHPVPSFAEAFAEAREKLGPGQTFYWNGKAYTTNLADEAPDLELALDSSHFSSPKGATTATVVTPTTP